MPKVEFRSQTVLIQVPVVVTDKSGQHVHDLNKEDFTLLENGKPVSVANFEELTANTAPLTAPAAVKGQYQNLVLAGPQPRNIVVIALDTVNTPFLDQAWVNVSSEVEKKKATFLAHMPAGSLSFDPTGRDQLNFDFEARAYDKNGKEAGQASLSFTKPVPQDQLASVRSNGLNFRNALQLAPGKYTVRFVVRDNVTGKVGSVAAPLTVN
jgi:hypothetical protein